jgi:hypothetical protein
LAAQFTASEYVTFVAMPFRDQFSYRQKDIFESVFCKAAETATASNQAKRRFAKPLRVDSGPLVASQVTEEIVIRILESHIFLADLTFQNAGVVVETGVALGLKPTKQIILTTQGSPHELHFDINHNTVIPYDRSDAVEQLAAALIGAATAFESECDHYIQSVKRRLTPEAILCLNWYGIIQKRDPAASLNLGTLPVYVSNMYGPTSAPLVFRSALRELFENRLVWTDYHKGVHSEAHGGEVDMWGIHATELGWLLIDTTWPELARSRQPVSTPRKRSQSRKTGHAKRKKSRRHAQ